MGLGAAAIIGGSLLAGSLFGQKDDKTKQVSKLNARQKAMQSILEQAQMAKMGRWIQTPKGLVFEYDPRMAPQYRNPVAAPLTQTQQTNLQSNWQIANQMKNLATRPKTNMFAGYTPGGGVPTQAPASYSQVPDRQINPLALTGQMMPRDEQAIKGYLGTDQGPQYIAKDWKKNAAYVNPIAAQQTGNFQGRVPDIGQAIQKTGLWNPAWGNVPPVGYLAPKQDRQTFGDWFKAGFNPKDWVNPDWYAWMPGKSYAQGGPMPGQGQYLVGEKGPEMHVDQMGRRNMIGEQGPEMFNPNTPGQVIPNNQLPPGMQQGNGPQAPTGQEQPLPGMGMGNQPNPMDMSATGQPGASGGQLTLTMLANALLPSAMTLAGQGRAEGGQVGYWYGANDQEYQMPNVAQGDWKQWKTSPEYGQLKSAGAPVKNWNTYSGAYGQAPAESKWGWMGQSDWSYNPTGGQQGAGAWTTPGQAGQAVPQNSGVNYNPAMGQYEMNPWTSQYTQPDQRLGDWSWNQQANAWTPQGYQWPTTPTTPDTGTPATGTEVIPGQAANITVPDTNTTPPPMTAQQAIDASNANMPQWNIDTSQQPQVNAWQQFQEMNPQAAQGITQSMTAQPTYQYNPAEINANWKQGVFEPGMTTWQEDVAPWLKEQFAATGNVHGSEMPSYLTRKTQQFVQSLNSERMRMLTEGRNREADALENLAQRKLAATQQAINITSMPSQIGFTQAQTNSVVNGIQSQQFRDRLQANETFAGINLANANAGTIWQALDTATDLQGIEKDREIAKTLVEMAKVPMMQNTLLGQEIQNFQASLNAIATSMGIEAAEQLTVEKVLTMSYEDFMKALGISVDTSPAQLADILNLGGSFNENIYTNNAIDWSSIGLGAGLLGGGWGT